MALRFRTHRCGFLSLLSISFSCPSSPSGLPPMLVATITVPALLGEFNLCDRVEHPVFVRAFGDEVAAQHLPVSRLVHGKAGLCQQVAEQHACVALVDLGVLVVDGDGGLRHGLEIGNR